MPAWAAWKAALRHVWLGYGSELDLCARPHINARRSRKERGLGFASGIPRSVDAFCRGCTASNRNAGKDAGMGRLEGGSTPCLAAVRHGPELDFMRLGIPRSVESHGRREYPAPAGMPARMPAWAAWKAALRHVWLGYGSELDLCARPHINARRSVRNAGWVLPQGFPGLSTRFVGGVPLPIGMPARMPAWAAWKAALRHVWLGYGSELDLCARPHINARRSHKERGLGFASGIPRSVDAFCRGVPLPIGMPARMPAWAAWKAALRHVWRVKFCVSSRPRGGFRMLRDIHP